MPGSKRVDCFLDSDRIGVERENCNRRAAQPARSTPLYRRPPDLAQNRKKYVRQALRAKYRTRWCDLADASLLYPAWRTKVREIWTPQKSKTPPERGHIDSPPAPPTP